MYELDSSIAPCKHQQVLPAFSLLYCQHWCAQALSSSVHPTPCSQLGLKFPKPGAEVAHQHVVDLGQHDEAALMAAEGNTFPLIIRLETVTERGLKEGHSLQVSTGAAGCHEVADGCVHRGNHGMTCCPCRCHGGKCDSGSCR